MMKMHRWMALAALVTLIASASWARQPYEARIDVKGKTAGVKLTVVEEPEGGRGEYASWEKDEDVKARYLTFRKNLTTSEWQPFRFTFQADGDCEATLYLSAKWKQDTEGNLEAIPTLYDDLTIEGAEGSSLDPDTDVTEGDDGALKIEGWSFRKDEDRSPELIDDASVAHSGSKCLKVTNHSTTFGRVAMKAGQPVTISVWVKAGE